MIMPEGIAYGLLFAIQVIEQLFKIQGDNRQIIKESYYYTVNLHQMSNSMRLPSVFSLLRIDS